VVSALSLVGVLNCPLLSRAPMVSCVVRVSQSLLCVMWPLLGLML